jgi:putative ABC transport system substrate-binding protein
MKRREFITLLGGAAAAWPLAAGAQQHATPVIGFLSSLSQAGSTKLVAGFHRGLAEGGFVAGKTVAIEYRWAEGHYQRLPAMAAELVARRVTVLVSSGGGPSLLAAKEATATTPIVFSSGVDPLKLGIIESFNRPGANITGVYILTDGLEAKRFGLLHDLTPAGTAIAMLYNPNNPAGPWQVQDVEHAARAVGRRLHVERATAEDDLEAAFGTIVTHQPGALLVTADPLFSTLRERLVALSARHRIPTVYQWREFAEAGGLMSYGTNFIDAHRHVGAYAGRILKRAKLRSCRSCNRAASSS